MPSLKIESIVSASTSLCLRWAAVVGMLGRYTHIQGTAISFAESGQAIGVIISTRTQRKPYAGYDMACPRQENKGPRLYMWL